MKGDAALGEPRRGDVPAIEPAAGVLAGWVILDQQLDAPTLAGIACVAIASAGATLTRREPPPEPEKPVDAVLT